MKKTGIIVGVLALAIVGGHYLLWKRQVAALGNAIEGVARQGGGNETITFTYLRRQAGGYPWDAEVTYVNPAVTIVSKEPPAGGETPAGSAPLAVSSARLDGNLSVRHGVILATGAVETTGVFHLSGKQDGAAFAYASGATGPSLCKVKLSDSPFAFITGRASIAAARSPRDYLRALSHLECSASGITVQDELLNTPVASIASQHLAVDSVPAASSGQYRVNVALSVADMLLTSNNSSAFLKLEPLLGVQDEASVKSLQHLVQKHPIPWFDAAKAGKQSLRFSGEYEGSLDQPAPPLRLNVKELTLRNDFYSLSWPFSVELSAAKDMVVHHHGTVTFTDASDKNVAESVDALLAIVKDDELVVADDLRAKLRALDAGAVHGLLPPMAPLKEIKTDADVKVTTAATQVTVDSLGFSSALFGLNVKGSGALRQGTMEGALTCSFCDTLVTRLSHYTNDLTSVLGSLEGRPPRFTFPEDAAHAVASLLHEYDTDQNPDTLTITVKKDAGGNMTISGKDAGMAMMGAAAKLAPYFPSLMPH